MPKITKSVVDNLPVKGVDYTTWDDTLKGFGVRVQASGRKIYIARYRTRDGQQRKLTIARCSDMPPDRARELARKAFGDVAAGGDPTQERRDNKTAPTVNDLAERYMREHATPFKKPNSVSHDDRYWKKRILPTWGTRKVESITKADVLTLHGSLAAKPVIANHVRALISKAFNLADDWGWRTTPNPVKGVRRYKIRQREQILTGAQFARLDASLSELVSTHILKQPFADLIRLLSLTGCRLSEIMTARREWVDHERRLLLLPDSKVGQRRINLPPKALAIIEAMPPHEWLIPGRIEGAPMRQPHVAWYITLKHAGLPKGTRIHDLRHTFGSLGHRAGLSQRQIAELLGHSDLATTARYLHGFVQDRQNAVNIVADLVTAKWDDK